MGGFLSIKFHPGMKFYSFHRGMKLTCKQKFFHPGTSFIPGWDFISVSCKRTLKSWWSNVQWKYFHTPRLKIWNICAWATPDYSFTYSLQMFWHDISWKLTLRNTSRKMGSQNDIMNMVTWLFLKLFYNVYNFIVEISMFKQSITLTIGHNKFDKRTVQNLQTRTHFLKKSRNQVDQIIDQLHLSKSIPNVTFKLISCQETCG